ncbi:MAG: uroporphyrinogen decarboxylase family protein [Planctomycetota bacterium]
MDSRECVERTLEFDGPCRIPHQVWVLPWARDHYPEVVKRIQDEFPDDIITSPGFCRTPPPGQGDRYAPGRSVDDWGCTFENIQKGAIGEVKNPQLATWDQVDEVRIPVERLSVDKAQVDAFCNKTDRFVLGAGFPRPFEQLQFIRGTVNLYLDLMDQPEGLKILMKRMHDFYMKEFELWAETAVDGLFIMDDWGSQNALLISPKLWRQVFKPLYRDYTEIARAHGKYVFMHSDGYIVDIMEDLVEIGIHAINSQVFCMGIDKLSERFSGRITFWGELDRQQLLPAGTRQEVLDAMQAMRNGLYRKGGLIHQFEFGLGANPDNVLAACQAW